MTKHLRQTMLVRLEEVSTSTLPKCLTISKFSMGIYPRMSALLVMCRVKYLLAVLVYIFMI